jgi:hypothetical protein
MRKLTVATLAAVLLAALTACTPPDEPITALAIKDGRPVGLLYVCRDGFSQLSVFVDEPSDGALIDWGVHGDATAGMAEIALLGPPPKGWQADNPAESSSSPDVSRSEQLTEWRPGVRYALSGHAQSNSMNVHFTTADFDRIGPDQVLAPVNRNKAKVVSRAAFERRAKETCE